MKRSALFLSLASLFLTTACAPEVGSKAWCEDMSEKPKGEWSANEAKDYASHCIFSNDDNSDDEE